MMIHLMPEDGTLLPILRDLRLRAQTNGETDPEVFAYALERLEDTIRVEMKRRPPDKYDELEEKHNDLVAAVKEYLGATTVEERDEMREELAELIR